MAVTLWDVTRRAGVSEATASRVLNRRRYVAAGTRVRVEKAAHDLGYVPNRAARDLSTARTSTIAMLVHHAQYPAHGEGTFSSRVVDGVSRALRGDHLTDDHGYRRLVCIAGPIGWPSTDERVAGVREQARRSGASVRVLHARETTMRDGAELAARLQEDPPDAVVAVNEAMAIGALHRLRSLPPERRPAVTGFDDIAGAQLTDPPLTTVAVDAIQIGAGAAELLMARIATPDRDTLPVREVRVPATVRLRRSCGCSDPSDPSPTLMGDG